MMRIAIRTDASVGIGSGHVMRCLALADRLQERRAEIIFLCRELEGDLRALIIKRGFGLRTLPRSPEFTLDWRQDARQTLEVLAAYERCFDWLIADHYQLHREWELMVRSKVTRLLVIDDMADRPHACDLLLNQNLTRQPRRYVTLLPSRCQQLIGPEYALLRQEFSIARTTTMPRDGRLRRILVFFGGGDVDNETAKALRGLALLDRNDLTIDVVVGSANPHREEVRALCAILANANFHWQIGNMAELMARADLAIGAGGSATWERCCVGLPALTAILADNQLELTEVAADSGVLLNLGWAQQLTAENYAETIAALDAVELQKMSLSAWELVDGLGAAKVSEVLRQTE